MMNETMLKSLGYEKDEVLGTDYLETFIPEDDRQLILKLLNNLPDLNETIVNEAHLLTKDGCKLLVDESPLGRFPRVTLVPKRLLDPNRD